MNADPDNETWLVECAGNSVVEAKATKGHDALSPIERLIYCLWVADYGMRNAGDLDAASDLYPSFQTEGRRVAGELALPLTLAAFELSLSALESSYFELFDGVCEEVRIAFQ